MNYYYELEENNQLKKFKVFLHSKMGWKYSDVTLKQYLDTDFNSRDNAPIIRNHAQNFVSGLLDEDLKLEKRNGKYYNKKNNRNLEILPDLERVLPYLDPNQMASVIGAIGEIELCTKFGWIKIDEDGFDAIAQNRKIRRFIQSKRVKDLDEKIENEENREDLQYYKTARFNALKKFRSKTEVYELFSYHGFPTPRIEIKTMSSFTATNVLAYNHGNKGDKYDYLAIYYRELQRVSLIPHHEVEKIVNTKGEGLTINFKPSLQKNHIVPKLSKMTEIFIKYEVFFKKQIK